jgi:hypothetical protein
MQEFANLCPILLSQTRPPGQQVAVYTLGHREGDAADHKGGIAGDPRQGAQSAGGGRQGQPDRHPVRHSLPAVHSRENSAKTPVGRGRHYLLRGAFIDPTRPTTHTATSLKLRGPRARTLTILPPPPAGLRLLSVTP